LKTLSLVKPFLYERRWFILIGLSSLVMVDFLQLLIPRFIKQAVDAIAILSTGHEALLFFGLKILAAGILIGGFRYGWRRCLIGTSRRVEEGLRNRLFNHLQTLSPSYFDQARTGDLMAHATNDLMNVRMAIGMGLVALTDAVVLGISAICFMAYINAKLTLFAMIPAPFIVLGARFFSRRMHRLYGKVQGDFSTLTEAIRERFEGIRLIKAHLREDEEAETVSRVSSQYIASNMSLAKIVGSFFPMMLFFTNLSNAVVLYLGGRQTIFSIITPGDFVAFISYLGLLTWPMMALGWVSNLIQRGKASLDRLQVIFDTRPRIADAPDARPLKQALGHIEFKGVTFSYSEAKTGAPSALERIDIRLKPGDMLGIVGPPGSGKSTLLDLIPRLYDVTGGCILLEGEDIRSYRVGDLRSQMTWVPQEPFLFAGTIRENILLGNDEKSASRLFSASREACLHDDVLGFPDGYDTLVGEKGVILSGGQKQRVALARALVNDPPILLLDDPISQVDTRTGDAIVRAIRSRSHDKTVIMASHRLGALSHADQIITLDDGRIVESGTHGELMAAGGYYAETFRLQEIEEAFDAR
jgi:ATP-binding cassette subfamily B protein